MRNIFTIPLLLILAGCDFEIPGGIDEQFGDQHFKSAVSAVELHKVRTGIYPESLDDLQYLGDWDRIWVQSVRYEKSDDGYNLYITRGWAGEPSLTLPADYRQGLGLRDSNVTWVPEEPDGAR